MIGFIDVIVAVTKILTGANMAGERQKSGRQKIYFANHTSNLDTIVLWASLPYELRKITRPVAAKDYWDQAGIKRHIATKELNVVFIERNVELRTGDPLDPLRQALDEGYNLIVFPEGQRNKEIVPGEFKSGIYRLHQEYPDVDLVPLYLENVSKTFPRGAPLPLPIICRAIYGKPYKFAANEYMDATEAKIEFLKGARLKVIDLIPSHIREGVTNFSEQVATPPVRT